MRHAGSDISAFVLFGEKSAEDTPDLIHVETIGSRASLHKWAISAHRHPAIAQILFVLDGSVEVEAGGELAKPAVPAIVLTPCDCPHAFRFAPGSTGWVVSISSSLLRDGQLPTEMCEFLLASSSATIASFAGTPGRGSMLDTVLRDIFQRGVNSRVAPSPAIFAALALVLTAAEEVAETPQTSISTTPGRRRELFRRFLGMIAQEYRSGWSVGDYADKLGCSQATLTRACREARRTSPGQLVIERRMLEAKRLLSFTNAGISRISDDLGFRDPAYFARSFKQFAGITPGTYRRRHTRPVD